MGGSQDHLQPSWPSCVFFLFFGGNNHINTVKAMSHSRDSTGSAGTQCSSSKLPIVKCTEFLVSNQSLNLQKSTQAWQHWNIRQDSVPKNLIQRSQLLADITVLRPRTSQDCLDAARVSKVIRPPDQ